MPLDQVSIYYLLIAMQSFLLSIDFHRDLLKIMIKYSFFLLYTHVVAIYFVIYSFLPVVH